MGDGKWAKEQDKRWGMGSGKGIGKRWERGSGGGKATRGKKLGRGSSKEERDGEKKQEREMGGVNRKKVRWGFRVSLAVHRVNMNSQSVTFFPRKIRNIIRTSPLGELAIPHFSWFP